MELGCRFQEKVSIIELFSSHCPLLPAAQEMQSLQVMIYFLDYAQRGGQTA